MRSSLICSSCKLARLPLAQCWLKLKPQPRLARLPRDYAHSSYRTDSEWKLANPDFDELELNEDYYESLGISADELADQLGFSASDADPMGVDLGAEDLTGNQLDAGLFLNDEDMSESAWGPQVRSLRQSGQHLTLRPSCPGCAPLLVEDTAPCFRRDVADLHADSVQWLMFAGNAAGRVQS